jgi:hypothetical protein
VQVSVALGFAYFAFLMACLAASFCDSHHWREGRVQSSYLTAMNQLIVKFWCLNLFIWNPLVMDPMPSWTKFWKYIFSHPVSSVYNIPKLFLITLTGAASKSLQEFYRRMNCFPPSQPEAQTPLSLP